MVSLSILLLSILIIIGIVATVVLLGGAGFIVVFGDIFICAAFIIFVIRYLIGKKK